MKLSNVFAKLTSSKTRVLSVVGGLTLAGAALTAAAPVAAAQGFGVGVQFGGPRYVAPAPPPVYRTYGPGFYAPHYAYGYVAPGYWDRRRAEDWRAHEYWEHHRAFYGRPEGYRGYAY